MPLGPSGMRRDSKSRPVSGWLDTPPADKHVLVYDGQQGEYRLLEKVADELWRRTGSRRKYTRAQLETIARRSGWRFHAITLPDPPESEWSDA